MSCNVFYPGEESTFLGVVLCGGQSTRMGQDKGLISENGVVWAQKAAEKLEELGIPVVISINSSQLDSYANYFLRENLCVDVEGIKGPLAGILSVHSQFIEKDLIVLACDMPNVKPFLFENLMDAFNKENGLYDFFVFENEGQFEPLLGIYSAEGLSKMASLASAGLLEKHSMKYVLETGNTLALHLDPALQEAFTNINSNEDLKK